MREKRLLNLSCGTAYVLVFAALGVVLILQGWRSRIPNFDMLSTIDAAQQFIDHGKLPETSVVTSFGSFTPPGLTWFMLPGVLLFRDPRLFEYVGSIFLYVGTLLGIFLIARRYFGPRCAVVAVALYGFSELGLSIGSTLFHRYPIHFFFVWMVYCVGRWVDENNPRFLAAAIAVWAVGINVFMEMAPAILVIPVIWLLYRRSIRVAPLLMAVALAAAVWYPYLRFERSRNFVDLRSQVFREVIGPTDFTRSWCDPSLVPQDWITLPQESFISNDRTSSRSRWAGMRPWASERATVVAESLLANFSRFLIPGAGAGLFLLTLIGLAAAFVGSGNVTDVEDDRGVWRQRLAWVAGGLTLLALSLNEVLLARFISADGVLATHTEWIIRVAQFLLVLVAFVLVVRRDLMARVVSYVYRTLSATAANTRVVAVSLAIPWLLLFVVADAERRFWWMWPLQVIMLAAAVTYVPARLKAPRALVWAGSLAVCLIVAANTMFLSRVQSWAHDGWAGRDAQEVQVADRVNALLRGQGSPKEISIGYEIDTSKFMVAFNSIDSRYKVGADLDLLFKHRYGIINKDRCAEGFQPSDKYRIVQIAPIDKYVGRDVAAQPTPGEAETGHNRIRPHGSEGDVPSADSYELISEVGVYQVLGRD
jgi:hypothetical protein